ncbi:MAG TPA: hypothetical protein VHW24_21335 [Bryobacteraceae bacterium]|jgi:hypothetical protein|nr:hypothetical protein [Bryobacteraceae bacterium]
MQFLLPETTVREAGIGPVVDIGEARAGTLILTLGITRILEKEHIDVAIWGSSDGVNFGTIPIAAYPQKCYCGTYQMHLDLSTRPDVKYLQVQWDAGRWSVGKGKPLFTLYMLLHAHEHEFAFAGA